MHSILATLCQRESGKMSASAHLWSEWLDGYCLLIWFWLTFYSVLGKSVDTVSTEATSHSTGKEYKKSPEFAV